METKKQVKTVLVIHGPNLNMLGKREPQLYGSTTLDQLDRRLEKAGRRLGVTVRSFQSNHEGAIVDQIQASMHEVSGLIINPAAFTHTSIAIRDAVLLLTVPVIEVHLSNIYRREPFRRHSYLADVATAQIAGMGAIGYDLALQAIVELIG